MADAIGPRLQRIHALSKQLNRTADDINKVVQGVETFLTEFCRIGIEASAIFHREEFEPADYVELKRIVYGRHAKAFRLYIVEESFQMDGPESRQETLWANCPRDLKLAAYMKLPELLDNLAKKVEETLDAVEVNTEAVLNLLPPVRNQKEASS